MSEERLDDITEGHMALLYTDKGDADSWAARGLRRRIRTLVREAKESGRHEMWVEIRLNTRGIGSQSVG